MGTNIYSETPLEGLESLDEETIEKPKEELKTEEE
jgi:hypothetical protein